MKEKTGEPIKLKADESQFETFIYTVMAPDGRPLAVRIGQRSSDGSTSFVTDELPLYPAEFETESTDEG